MLSGCSVLFLVIMMKGSIMYKIRRIVSLPFAAFVYWLVCLLRHADREILIGEIVHKRDKLLRRMYDCLETDELLFAYGEWKDLRRLLSTGSQAFVVKELSGVGIASFASHYEGLAWDQALEVQAIWRKIIPVSATKVWHDHEGDNLRIFVQFELA